MRLRPRIATAAGASVAQTAPPAAPPVAVSSASASAAVASALAAAPNAAAAHDPAAPVVPHSTIVTEQQDPAIGAVRIMQQPLTAPAGSVCVAAIAVSANGGWSPQLAAQHGVSAAQLADWCNCWYMLIEAVARCCAPATVSCDLHDTAVAMLERMLTDVHGHALSAGHWRAVFVEVVFPMVDELLQHVNAVAANPDDAGEDYVLVKRSRGADGASAPLRGSKAVVLRQALAVATAMVSKAFLLHLSSLAPLPEFHLLWMQLLRLYERISAIAAAAAAAAAAATATADQLSATDATGALPLRHSVRAHLRALLLDLSTASSKPEHPEKQFELLGGASDVQFWRSTWASVEGFCPGIQREIEAEVALARRRFVPIVTTAPGGPHRSSGGGNGGAAGDQAATDAGVSSVHGGHGVRGEGFNGAHPLRANADVVADAGDRESRTRSPPMEDPPLQPGAHTHHHEVLAL